MRLMRTRNIQFHDKISISICFLELSEEFRRESKKNEFEFAMVNEPSVFELLKFDCKYLIKYSKWQRTCSYCSYEIFQLQCIVSFFYPNRSGSNLYKDDGVLKLNIFRLYCLL